MNLRILVLALLVSIMSIPLVSLHSQNYDFKIYKSFNDLQREHFDIRDDRVHVINFWATWCAPCIKELPYFDALTEKYGDKIKVTLVSLDFPKRIDSALVPFLAKNQLKSEVVLLDDGRANEWIDMVDPNWSGAIPATLVFMNGKKRFYEQEFHSFKELEEIVFLINQ